MGNIADKIKFYHSTLPAEVELVAVSKFHPVESLLEAYDAGQRIFGESRVQELLAKIPQLPADVRWHFIGHLQTNKVKQLVGRVALIESVDSWKLLSAIDEQSLKAGVVSDVLLQLYVAAEETKFGFSPDELIELCSEGRHLSLKATRIRGVMGMASNTDDEERVKADFTLVADTFNRLSAMPGLQSMSVVSMGMSGDYRLAIDCGSTLVRIGTDIFGGRQY